LRPARDHRDARPGYLQAAPDELQRRIEAAARYVPLADLALSPQCGFASTAGGNQLTVDDERRKLELVVGTASKVWG
jgi:5-methyltetrahydropteroyltriglutamate--homocysteine methyltransferase